MSNDTCPTVRVKSDASPDGVMIINLEDFDDAVHVLADPVPPPPGAVVPPLPGAPDPLDLPADWRGKEAADLKKLAEVVSGRAVENKAQAIAVIEAALAAK